MPFLGLVRFFLPSASKMIVGLVLAGVYAGIAGAAVATYVGWRHHQYMRGWNEALAQVAKQDAKAAQAATAVKNRVDQCYDSGGDWDGAKGICITGASGVSGGFGLFGNN